MMPAAKLILAFAMLACAVLAFAACRGKESNGSTSTPAATEATQPAASPTAAVSPAASSTPAATASKGAATAVTHSSMKFGGEERTYRLYVPTSLKPGTKVPLVVGLHGGLGSGDNFAQVSGFEDVAQSEGFIVVFPDGVKGGMGSTWNAGGCCGQAQRANVDDVGFLAALIDMLEQQEPIDPARVFMTGHSNGAMMSFRFGCERPELVKAIAPVAGTIETPDCKPAHGTNLLTIHGDADENVPIDGGIGSRSIAGVPFNSMAKTMEMWTTGMNCGAPTTTTAGAVTTSTWAGCKDGTVARYIILAGQTHAWPGGPRQGATPAALDATKAVWAFFKGFNQ